MHAKPYQKPLNAIQMEGFGQNQHTYCEQLTIADTDKNHLVDWNPDWFTLSNLFSSVYWKMELKMILSNILLQSGRSETGL